MLPRKDGQRFDLIFHLRSTIMIGVQLLLLADGVAQWQERAVHTRVVQGSTPCTVTILLRKKPPNRQFQNMLALMSEVLPENIAFLVYDKRGWKLANAAVG